MRKRFVELILLLLCTCVALGQGNSGPDQNSQVWGSGGAASGTPLQFPDAKGTITDQFEIKISGTAPSGLTTTLVGCMRGGTCSSTLATSSGTSSQIITPSSQNLYDYYKITLSWTGGDSTTKFTVNRSGTVARTFSGAAALLFGPIQQNVTYSKIHVSNAGSGDVDLYTVPANSRALVIYNDYNTAGTTTTFSKEIKVSGTYYRLSSDGTRATLTASTTGFGIILNAGETFAVHTSQAGMNFFGTAYIFPSSSGLQSPRLLTLASGNNTLYTCCTIGSTAIVVLGNGQILPSSNGGIVEVTNVSGGSLNFYYNGVNNGDTPATGNQALNATAVANNSTSVFSQVNWTLTTGDFINVNSSGTCTGCVAWTNIFEQ